MGRFRDALKGAGARRAGGMKGAWIRILSRVAFVLVGILLALVVLEVALQGRDVVARTLEPDPYIGTRHVPGGVFQYTTPDFSTTLRFNSLGFHDRDHAQSKPPGAFRIVVLGDSFMDALQVPYEETFAYHLERELTNRSVQAEVINLGVQNFGTSQEFFALQRYGLPFQPDLVLLAFSLNDPGDNVANRFSPYFVRNSTGKLEEREAVSLPLKNPVAGLFRRLFPSVYTFVGDALRSGGPSPNVPVRPVFFDSYRADPPPSYNESWNLTLDILRLVADRARENGARFSLFMIPGREMVYPALWQGQLLLYPAIGNLTVDFDRSGRILRNFSATEGVPFLDLSPGLREYANRSGNPLYFTSQAEAHWTAWGNRAAAELVAGWLVRERLVP